LAELLANTDIRLVTFLLNGEAYGVDVRRIREIISMVEIAKTANTPIHVKGMIDLRGSGVPVLVDEESSCIAVMEFDGNLVGFVFDDISDVIRIKRDDIKPFLDAFSRPWIEGIIKIGEKLGIFLNLQHLA